MPTGILLIGLQELSHHNMTKATIIELTESTTNVQAMNDLNDNFDALNAQLPADADWAIVSRLGTQTITNKTLTSPTINTPTITTPTVTDGTFTNPTLVSPQLGTPDSWVLTNCTGLPVAGGGTGLSTTTAYGVLHWGTTDTGALQNSGTPWASGTVLTSTWPTSLPTWTSISGWYWDFATKLATDFVVTNNATLQDVTGFSFAATTGQSWFVQIIGTTSASNTTGDIKVDLVTTGTWNSSWFWKWNYFDGTTGSIATNTGLATSTTSAMLWNLVVNNWDNVVRWIYIESIFTMAGNWDVKFQIANNAAASGRTSTLKAGSYILARKLSV